MPLSPRMLEDFDVPVKALTPLSSNNTSAISIAWDPMGAWSKKQTWLLCSLPEIARAKSGCAFAHAFRGSACKFHHEDADMSIVVIC